MMEDIALDYNDYIKSLEKTDHLQLMRTRIKKIELRNVPFITDAKVVFSKYNILGGAYGSGKTFLIHLIYDAYTKGKTELEWLTTHPDYRNASVKIVYNSIAEWRYAYPRKSEDIDERLFEEHKDICFLFDEPDILYNNKEIDGFLNYLKGIDVQIILTVDTKNDFNHPSEFKKINIA
ncbi:MAG: hypothetical protein KAW47_01680 [Thermoplasmatales archaeon]|nr:hypothetical protein [Thermoplasmatales archaeon]